MLGCSSRGWVIDKNPLRNPKEVKLLIAKGADYFVIREQEHYYLYTAKDWLTMITN